MKFDLVVLCTKFWIDLLGVVNMSSVTVIFALIYSTNIYGIFNVYMLEILYETSILRDFVKIDSVKKKKACLTYRHDRNFIRIFYTFHHSMQY